MSKDLTRSVAELNESVKNYVKVRVDLMKLSLLEKATKFTTYIFSLQVIILFSVLVIAFVAAAFAVWYGQNNNLYTGLLIAAGCMVLVGVIFILFRKKIITTSVIRNFSEIMFEDE